MATVLIRTRTGKQDPSYLIQVFLGKDSNGKRIRLSKTIKGSELEASKIEGRRRQQAMYDEAKRIAEEWEAELLHRSSPNAPRADKTKFSQFTQPKNNPDGDTETPLPSPWEEWLNKRVAAGFIAKSTAFHYTDDYRIYCKNTFDNMTLDEVTPQFAKDFITKLQIEEHYSSDTVKHALACMRNLYKYIIEETNVVSEDPFHNVKVTKAKHEKKSSSFYSADETRRFLEVLDTKFTIKKTYSRGKTTRKTEYEIDYSVSNKWRAFFKTMITTGLRTGEMNALTWNAVDFENATIKVNQAVTRTGPKAKDREINDTKTNESVRTLKTSQMALEALQDWKEEQLQMAETMGTKWEGKPANQFGNQLIFPQDTGSKLMNASTAGHAFHKIIRRWNAFVNQQYPELTDGWETEEPDNNEKRKKRKKADDTRVRPDDDGIHLREIRGYDLRHTFATFELEHGTAPNVLARRMGHSNLQMIMQTYVHPFDDAAKNDANTFDQLSPGKSGTAKQVSEEEKLRKDVKEKISLLASQINSMDTERLQNLVKVLDDSLDDKKEKDTEE